MSNETARAKMFGPTPGAVRQLRNQEREQAAIAAAKLPPFAGAVKAASMAGSAFGDVLGAAMGMQDPAMQQALQMEEVKREVMNLGLDFNDPAQRKDYFKAVQDGFARRGMFDHAENARQMQISEEMAERQMLVNETEAASGALRAEADMQSAFNALTGASKTWRIYEHPETGHEVQLRDGDPEVESRLNEGYEEKTDLTREDFAIYKASVESKAAAEVAANRARGRGAETGLKQIEVPMERVQRVATVAPNIINDSDRIIRMLESGEMRPGFAIDFRTWIGKTVGFFDPALGNKLGAAVDAPPASVEEAKRLAADQTAHLAAALLDAGRSPSAAWIRKLEEAGASVHDTAPGMYINAVIARARAMSNQKINEAMAQHLSIRPDEDFESDSYYRRQANASLALAEFQKQYSPGNFMPSDEALEDLASRAQAMSLFRPVPLEKDWQEGEKYLTGNGKVAIAWPDPNTGQLELYPIPDDKVKWSARRLGYKKRNK